MTFRLVLAAVLGVSGLLIAQRVIAKRRQVDDAWKPSGRVQKFATYDPAIQAQAIQRQKDQIAALKPKRAKAKKRSATVVPMRKGA